VWYVWTKLHRRTYHFLVSWFTCNTDDSYKKITNIMERSNNLMVRRRKSCLQNIMTRFVCEMARNIPIVFMKLVKEKNGSEPKMPQRMCHLKNNQFSIGIYPIGRNWRFVMPSTRCKGVYSKNTINTLLFIPGKTKDGLSRCRDLKN
jgi:hypothetical protein